MTGQRSLNSQQEEFWDDELVAFTPKSSPVTSELDNIGYVLNTKMLVHHNSHQLCPAELLQ